MRVVSFGVGSCLLMLLSACMTYNYENVTDYSLCFSHATSSPSGPNAEARYAEIAKRRVDCRKFADQINEDAMAIRVAQAGAPQVHTTNITKVESDD